jgi:uncharacterized membrane protein
MVNDIERMTQEYIRKHIRFGWWALLCFLTLGIVLESLHAFKVGWYMNVDNSTRRLMWTLAHAHGTLLAIVNIVFGTSLATLPLQGERQLAFTSNCLLAAGFLLPVGFFVGGIFSLGGDPGLGITLVPLGALCLLVGVLLVAKGPHVIRDARSQKSDSQQNQTAKHRKNKKKR